MIFARPYWKYDLGIILATVGFALTAVLGVFIFASRDHQVALASTIYEDMSGPFIEQSENIKLDSSWEYNILAGSSDTVSMAPVEGVFDADGNGTCDAEESSQQLNIAFGKVYLTRAFDVTPGNVYKVHAWVNVPSGALLNQDWKVQGFASTTNTPIGTDPALNPIDFIALSERTTLDGAICNGWRQYRSDSITADAAGKIYVTLGAYNNNAEELSVLFDTIEVVEQAAAPISE